MYSLVIKFVGYVDKLISLLIPVLLKRKMNIKVSRLRLRGVPLIDVRNNGRLCIGENVLLNSRNLGYHINLYSRVKLFVDRPGASIEIGDNTRLHGSCIHAQSKIVIGKNCLIAGNCHIFDSNGHSTSFDDVDNRIHTSGSPDPIIIEDSVWIGANAIILPGVHIGRGSIIGAGSIVTNNIPPMVLAAGNPAKVIKVFNPRPDAFEKGG